MYQLFQLPLSVASASHRPRPSTLCLASALQHGDQSPARTGAAAGGGVAQTPRGLRRAKAACGGSRCRGVPPQPPVAAPGAGGRVGSGCGCTPSGAGDGTSGAVSWATGIECLVTCCTFPFFNRGLLALTVKLLGLASSAEAAPSSSLQSYDVALLATVMRAAKSSGNMYSTIHTCTTVRVDWGET